MEFGINITQLLTSIVNLTILLLVIMLLTNWSHFSKRKKSVYLIIGIIILIVNNYLFFNGIKNDSQNRLMENQNTSDTLMFQREELNKSTVKQKSKIVNESYVNSKKEIDSEVKLVHTNITRSEK